MMDFDQTLDFVNSIEFSDDRQPKVETKEKEIVLICAYYTRLNWPHPLYVIKLITTTFYSRAKWYFAAGLEALETNSFFPPFMS